MKTAAYEVYIVWSLKFMDEIFSVLEKCTGALL